MTERSQEEGHRAGHTADRDLSDHGLGREKHLGLTTGGIVEKLK